MIIIGSTNPVKVAAVRELQERWPELAGEIEAVAVITGVPDQPMSLEQTVRGAYERARVAFDEHFVVRAHPMLMLAIGLESGLTHVPGPTAMTWFDVCACVIIDKHGDASVGLSGMWELPHPVVQRVAKGRNLTEAFVEAGFSTNNKLGEAEGAIGVLSEGRVTRKDYTKQAIEMALISRRGGRAP